MCLCLCVCVHVGQRVGVCMRGKSQGREDGRFCGLCPLLSAEAAGFECCWRVTAGAGGADLCPETLGQEQPYFGSGVESHLEVGKGFLLSPHTQPRALVYPGPLSGVGHCQPFWGWVVGVLLV